MRKAFVPFFLGALSCAAPPPKPFLVEGRLIHPACIYALSCRLSDLRPIAAAVDVRGCEESDEYSGGEVSRLRGGVWYRDPEALGQGYFAYWYVGTTSRGVDVLTTAWSGGGSGIFMDVIFVRLDRRTYFNFDKMESRWIVTSLGQVNLGDRSDKDVSLEGDTVVLRSPDGKVEKVAVPDP